MAEEPVSKQGLPLIFEFPDRSLPWKLNPKPREIERELLERQRLRSRFQVAVNRKSKRFRGRQEQPRRKLDGDDGVENTSNINVLFRA
jgi:hypothetical protein